MQFIDAVDSIYQYVKTRVAVINPQRAVKGLLMAQDWPYAEVVFEAFYLLNLGENPVGREAFSPTIPIVSHELQWVWIVKGVDINTGQVGTNRGQRFRTSMQMKGEISQALYPYFAEKKTWGMEPGVEPPKWVGRSLDPQEFIGWAPPQYRERFDKDSGLVYGSVALRVWNMLDPITA